MYRKGKYANWEALLLKGAGCEAAFKRMLKSGLVTSMYDHSGTNYCRASSALPLRCNKDPHR